MQTYDRSVRKDHEQVLTASSDIGQFSAQISMP